MKSAIVCYVCGKLKKESESYQVKITSYGDSLQQQRYNDLSIPNTSKKWYATTAIKVRLCRKCTKAVGYKVKVEKLKIKKK